jgi:hypothetical protein
MAIYKDRVIGFIDILGWKKLVQDSATNEGLLLSIDSVALHIAQISEFCPQINETYKEIIKEIVAENPIMEKVMVAETDVVSTHFSDTIVLSSSPNKGSVSSLVSVVIGLSLVLLKAGYCVRGAIVRGQLHHTQGSLYGPALISAYELEKNNAIYPRIILGEDVLEFLVNKDWCQVDQADSLTFLNVLHHANQADLLVIEERLKVNIIRAEGNLSVIQKLNWLQNYLNLSRNGK